MSNLFGNLNGIAAGIYQLVRQEFIDRPLPVPANDAMNVNYLAPGAGAAPRRVFDKLAEFVSVADYGAALDGVTDDAAAVRAAQVRAGRRAIAFSGVVHIATPVTITSPILDTLEQIFSETSQVTIANGRPIRPEWFGLTAGNIRRAVNATPARGGVVLLDDAVYPPSYDSATGDMFNNRGGVPGVDYMVKKHISIQGTRLPEYADDNHSLINGTVIQGTFYVSSECAGFQADKIGADVGVNVVAALYGGVDHDGFCFLQTNKAAPVYAANVHIGRVRGLCSGPTSQAHAVLVEAVDGGSIEFAEGRMANHGVVVKSRGMVCGVLMGSLNHGEDVICKSDDYANMAGVVVSHVVCSGAAGGDPGIGFMILAAGASGGGVQVGNLYTERKNRGLVVQASGGMVLGDVTIGNWTCQSCPNPYSLIGNPIRVRIDTARLNDCQAAVFVDDVTVNKTNSIGRLEVASAVDAMYVGGKLAVESLFCDNVTGNVINYFNATARVQIGNVDLQNTPNFWNIAPALAGTWEQHPGGNTFAVSLKNGAVALSGLVRGGADSTITVLPAQLRPVEPVRAFCGMWNGAVYSTVEVLIAPDGTVGTSSFAMGAGGYLSLVASWPAPF